MLFLRTFPSPLCVFGSVLEVSRRGPEAEEGVRPLSAGLCPAFPVDSGRGGLSSAHPLLSRPERLRVPCEFAPVSGTVQSRMSATGYSSSYLPSKDVKLQC